MNITMQEPEVTEKPSTALTVQDRAALALGSTQTRLDLAAMAAKSAHLVEVKNKAARDEVHGAAMALASARVAISKTGKAARDDATKFSKAVIAEETSLIEITAAEEKRLLALRDAWDEQVAIEKAAKEQAERERITEIHRRIAEIRAYQSLAAGCRTAAAIQTLIDKLSNLELTGFEEFEDEAKTARVDTMHRMEEAHAQKFSDEAERARIKAEQDAAAAELVKARAELAAAKAEQDRIAKANRDAAIAEADRLATERQAQEDAAAARNQAALADIQRQRDEFAAEQAKALAEREAIEQQLAFERRLVDEQKAALVPVVIAPIAIEIVAEPAPNQNDFDDGAVDAEFLPDTPKNQAVIAAWAPDKPNRPTDRAMLGVLALHFKVLDRIAFDWLYTFDFDAVSDALLAEEHA